MQPSTAVMFRQNCAPISPHRAAPSIPRPKRACSSTPWDKAIYAKRQRIKNVFSRLKDCVRIALRRDKTRRSWMGFAYLAAAMINLRRAQFSPTAQRPHHPLALPCTSAVGRLTLRCVRVNRRYQIKSSLPHLYGH